MRRRRKEDEHPQHERWLVSYADFMTLLFALFVVLFASSHHDKTSIKKVSTAVKNGFQEMGTFSRSGGLVTGGSQPSPQSGDAGVDVMELQQKLNRALGKEIARQQVALRMTPEGFVISLHELGFFNSGQARLLPGAEEPIKRIAGVLMQYGLDISTARATAVAMMLLNEANFDPKRMSIAGYAQYHPAASNDTEDGRRANRRVDIVVVSATKPTPISVQ
jgi:chemotaxis protein MotB